MSALLCLELGVDFSTYCLPEHVEPDMLTRISYSIFGDAPNLCKSSMLWWHVIQAMAKDPCRVGFYMHLTCKKHDEKSFIKGEI